MAPTPVSQTSDVPGSGICDDVGTDARWNACTMSLPQLGLQ